MQLPSIERRTLRIFLAPAMSAAIASTVLLLPNPVGAQSTGRAMGDSCHDAARALSLRASGIEEAAVADPGGVAKLRKAAQYFYRCEQSAHERHLRQLFQGYYANSLYRVGNAANDPKASSLAAVAAQELRSSEYDDVRSLVSSVPTPTSSHPPGPIPTATATPQIVHSATYCHEFSSNMSNALLSLSRALNYVTGAGNDDVQILSTTTARYGGAFKEVEDDFASASQELSNGLSYLGNANTEVSALNDQERQASMTAVQTTQQAINYTDTYNRLAVAFERGINNVNRQVARARIAQALASTERNTSYTSTSGNTSCSSFGYSTNCYENSSSTTTYNNSAVIAQQNAANALALAQSGRLSYAQANDVLNEGLPLLSQLHIIVDQVQPSWDSVCAERQSH